jgi:hypothetical protein
LKVRNKNTTWNKKLKVLELIMVFLPKSRNRIKGFGLPEGSAANAALQLVRILAVLGSLVLHPSTVGGEDGATLPSAERR